MEEVYLKNSSVKPPGGNCLPVEAIVLWSNIWPLNRFFKKTDVSLLPDSIASRTIEKSSAENSYLFVSCFIYSVNIYQGEEK